LKPEHLRRLREILETSKLDSGTGNYHKYHVLPDALREHAQELIEAAEKVAKEQKELGL
jgi:HEPN domain-containing protein